MGTLSFHPDAENRFNLEANRVFGLVQARERPAPSLAPEIQLDIHTHEVLQSDIQGPMTGGLRTRDGRDLAIYREHNGKIIGFFDSAYQELEKLTNKIHLQQSIRDLVTSKEVLDAFFEWTIKKHKIVIDESFTSFLDSHLAGLLGEHEIWVPISGLIIFSDITIGPIILRSISRAMVTQWKESCSKTSKVPPTMLENKFINNFQEIQGFAAGIVKRTGTKKRAIELAIEDVSRIVEIIRAFHFPVLRSGVRSHLALKGQECFPTEFAFNIGPEGCPRIYRSIVGSAPMDFVLNQEQVTRLSQCGVWYVCTWLFKKRTDLEDKILLSISLLSKSTLTTNLSDRLVYVFAALESLLLVGDTDQILHALAERFAFFIADDGPGRRDLRDRVRKVYGLRSRFVHHGHEPADRELVDQFLFDVHVFYMLLVGRSKDFESKDMLLQQIDEIKLNGESFGQRYPDPGNDRT